MLTSDTSGLRQFDTAEAASDWLRLRGCISLESDSRRITPGGALLAWPGRKFDARDHAKAALAGNAIAALVEAEDSARYDFDPMQVASVKNLKQLAGAIADQFYGNPSASLSVVAITGTNGKTSTAWWLSQALLTNCCFVTARKSLLNYEQQSQSIRRPKGELSEKSEISCLMVGTLGHGQVPHVTSGELTTPDAVTLHQLLAQAVDQGATSAAIEASSVGIAEGRLSGVFVRVAVFTNFSHDHLDYHGDLASYWREKRRLFDTPGLQAVVINIDDTKGRELAADLNNDRAEPLDIWTTSLDQNARLSATNITTMPSGMQFDVVEKDLSNEIVSRATAITPSFGHFNVSNLLGVIGAQRALGIGLGQATAALIQALPVPGRLEIANPSDDAAAPIAVVDYAHTPDALAKALKATRDLATARNGRLWCVFGCGGNRDALKRPLMARAAQLNADHVVLTSDNPRFERASDIAADVKKGFTDPGEIAVELDRAAAIEWAIRHAGAHDVILIAGKGHEAYQEINGIKHPFSDRSVAQSSLTKIRTERGLA